MKGLIVIFCITGSLASFGQDEEKAVVHKYALGGRLAGGAYYGPELSFQLGITPKNRFEFDLGARVHPSGNWYRYTFTTCFHWDFHIVSGLNFFVGPGAQAGVYVNPGNSGDTYFPFAIGGQIGLEFDFNEFDVPLVAALDSRPMFDLYSQPWAPWYFDGHVAASLRYTFKK